MDGLISVIVPVYNAEKYIERCVDSILGQTYRNFELLLIDDGSLDGSASICKKYAEDDHRISVISQPNGGAGKARNTGIKLAKGEYVAFVDSDDYISPSYLENLYKAALSGEFDIVQCNYLSVSSKNIRVILEESVYNPTCVKEISKVEALNRRMYNVCVWGKLYRHCVFDDVAFVEGTIYEDDAIYYKLIMKAGHLAILEDELYYYYMTSNSVMRNDYHLKSTAFISIYKERADFFKRLGDGELVVGTYERFCRILILFWARCSKDEFNENDLDEIMRLYRESYSKIIKSQFVSSTDKPVLIAFRYFPRLTSFIINLLRR